jgi:hypothetical protein
VANTLTNSGILTIHRLMTFVSLSRWSALRLIMFLNLFLLRQLLVIKALII